MQKKFLMTVSEIMEELGVSKSFAYKLMQKMNKELEAKGFTVINGKVWTKVNKVDKKSRTFITRLRYHPQLAEEF